MKRATIILLLLFLLLGCSTMDRPEIKASEPTVFPFELVKSSFKNNTSEMLDTIKPEPTESECAHLSTSDEIPAEIDSTMETDPISPSAGSCTPQSEPALSEAPIPELSAPDLPEQPQMTPETAQSEQVQMFDVDVWLNFAQCYGSEIGLVYDSNATGCWDTPLEVNAGCIYLERDICDTLDWYKTSGFTFFCVWSENLGNGNYNIYIGYA